MFPDAWLPLPSRAQIKQNVLLKYKYLAGFLRQHAPDIYSEVGGHAVAHAQATPCRRSQRAASSAA